MNRVKDKSTATRSVRSVCGKANRAISPRIRISENLAEFELEKHLEDFFIHWVLPELSMSLLASQYTCSKGICDILALGPSQELIITELKNIQDSHVIEQITEYYEALTEEKPFHKLVDYSQPIRLYTVCPSYHRGIETVVKYHRLEFNVLGYEVEVSGEAGKLKLFDWLSNEPRITILMPLIATVLSEVDIPAPPTAFLNLLKRCNQEEQDWALQTRDQIYSFFHNHQYNLRERPDGQWTRFERNKQLPVAELGWDSQREALAIHLWLPFTTVNGALNKRSCRSGNYKRTSMMRLWVDGGIVKHVGHVENQRRRCITVSIDEINKGEQPVPTKLRKYTKKVDDKYWVARRAYWKGLAMHVRKYKDDMDVTIPDDSLQSFVRLALDYSLRKANPTAEKPSPTQQNV